MGKLTLRGVPNEKQKQFFSATSRFVAYGGARGGGKSWALRRKLVLMCAKWDGISCLIIRRSYPELRENHIRPLRAELAGIAKYSESQKAFTFPNGSRIRLGYLESESDVQRYQGAEFDIIALDEATQLTEYQFQTLKACLRGTNGLPKRMYITCNPGGVGHGWVKRLFIDREYRASEKAEDYSFIQALVYDNKKLIKENPEYLSQLESLPPELREAWLYGKWDVFSGQFFSEFDADIHTEEFVSPPEESVIYAAMDYGLDMLAVVFVAVDKNGRAFVFDELCEKNLIVSKAAEKILEKSKGYNITSFIAPADLWNRQKDSGKSIFELFAENGVPLTKISGSRVEGWLALKEWLKVYEKDGKKESAMVISRQCKDLVAYLPRLLYDKKNPSDCSTEPHEITHITDALRYFAASRAVMPYRCEEVKPEKLATKLSKYKRIIQRG